MASATYVIAFVSLLCLDLSCGIEMSLNKNAESGQSLDIIIDIGQITALMTLTRPGGSTETCFAPIGGNPGSCTTGLSQDFATGKTTFTIGSVLRSRDEGEWTSSHGSDPPGSINITVLTVPTSLNVSQTIQSLTLSAGTSNTKTLTVVVPCVYPEASLSLAYVPTGGGSAVSATDSTSTCTSTGSTGCSDTNANSYTCTITPQYEAGLVAGTTYNMQVTVNLEGQYQSIGFSDTITDTSFIMQGTPTTPSPCRCDWDWLPCDWECYYFYIIIAAVVVVMVFLLVVGVCCCCRHGYCCNDDAEACVCCMRKKKSSKDSVNLNENGNTRSAENIRLNENENGQKNVGLNENENVQKNVPGPSENGRQVNPSESGKEDTSESPCHNNPAYYASEGTDM